MFLISVSYAFRFMVLHIASIHEDVYLFMKDNIKYLIYNTIATPNTDSSNMTTPTGTIMIAPPVFH